MACNQTNSDDDIVAMASLSVDTGFAGKSSNSTTKKPKESAIRGNKKTTPTSDSEDSSDEDESDRKAPNQLIMEFLECVMSNDLDNALKLCKMILLYEPNNAKALKFLPLLQEKKEQDEAESEEDDDSEETDDSDEDSDSDSEDTDDSSEDEEDENAENSKTSIPNGHCDTKSQSVTR